MGDENQPSKKRAAGRQLSRDNPGLDDEEDVSEPEMGTFKKASEDVLATRRIVKVRRQQTSNAPSAPSSNPFAGISLVPPAATAPANATSDAQDAEDKTAGEDPDGKGKTNTEAKVNDKQSEEEPGEVTPAESAAEANELDQANRADAGEPVAKAADEKEAEKTPEADPADEKQAESDNAEGKDKKESEAPDGPLSSFQQLSNSQNAFTGLSGTGFSSSSFSFGSIQKDGSPSQSSLPSFSFGASNNGSTPLFGSTGTSIGSKSEGSVFKSMPEVPRETGEENEETVFSADSALFEFLDGRWKERGKGEVKVNVLKRETLKARLVMRAKGNLRLILNAGLYLDMKLTKMDKKGITFACFNTATEGKDGLSTFALKFKDGSIVEEFSSAVLAHKGKPATPLKTPENSPKASDD